MKTQFEGIGTSGTMFYAVGRIYSIEYAPPRPVTPPLL
jgi:hypothetical protein